MTSTDASESAKAVVRRNTEEVQGGGNFDLFEELFADNFLDHTPQPGRTPDKDGARQLYKVLRTAFPDMNVTPEIVVQDEDTIAFAYTLAGTHTGPLGKIPPSGKKVKIRGMQISKFKDGKMVERWGSSDELGLLKQIGVIRD